MLTLAPQTVQPYNTVLSERPWRSTAPGSRPKQFRLPIRNTQDVMIDRFVTRIYSIISTGPVGGFVRYAVGPRNELYVDRTGNRSEIQDIVDELLPEDACRYIAYKIKYRKDGGERTKMIWFVWSPESAPKTEPAKYLNGLASTLIGLDCDSTIPILRGKTNSDLDFDKIMAQI